MTRPKALILAESMHLAYRVGWQRETAAELRRLPEIEAQRDEARRTARQAHEMGTRVVAQRDALLEALKTVLAAGRGTSGRIILEAADEAAARAAIAAVEGEKA